MYIRCPNCGRRGFLPDRLVPAANSLRCRKCRAHFVTPELARLGSDRAGVSAYETTEGGSRRENSSSFLADGYFSGYEEPGSARELGPGDSNYELTFTLTDAGGDSSDEWEAGAVDSEPEAPSSDEIEAVEVAIEDPSRAARWPQRFIVSWAPYWIGGVVALLAIAIPVVGYLLWCTLLGVPASGLPAPSLIAGLACAIGLLVISVPLMLVAVSVTELVQEARLLRGQPGRRV